MGLHDASPPDLVEAMAKDVELEMGWGRLIFGQTFADAEKLAETLRQEEPGRRDICIYARESHVVVAGSPTELFIDPSHTYRLRFTGDDQEVTAGTARHHGAHPQRPERCRCHEPGLRAVRHGARTGRHDLEQPRRTCRR